MKKVCIFCGSSSGTGHAYTDAARHTADEMVRRGLGLVYGGSHVGLMGILADTVLAAGGKVYGVIPQSMVKREIAHRGLTQLDIVETMHERKARMSQLADAFLVLPGAYGTLDEFFEVLTWAQLRIHGKPIGVLNVGGFFDPLFAFLDRCTTDGFLKQSNRELFLVDDDPGRLLEQLVNHKARIEEKW